MKNIDHGDVIAIGDIHGSVDLLRGVIDYVQGTGCTLVFLGDLIDRGPSSLECLSIVKHLCDNPGLLGIEQTVCLLGNHEQLLVDACEDGDDSLSEAHWVESGGNLWEKNLLKRYVPWIKTLPYIVMDQDTIFVHAGILPGQDPVELINEGRHLSLIWIREPFVTKGPQLWGWTTKYKRVIHGHTPVLTSRGILETPDVSPSADRIGIDTGAVWTGVLTGFNSTKDTYFSIRSNDQSY